MQLIQIYTGLIFLKLLQARLILSNTCMYHDLAIHLKKASTTSYKPVTVLIAIKMTEVGVETFSLILKKIGISFILGLVFRRNPEFLMIKVRLFLCFC